MPLTVQFELCDEDLAHFRALMNDASEAARNLTPGEIIEAADELLTRVRDSSPPVFMRQRLDTLATLIAMPRDAEWHLPDGARERVLSALAYFCQPDGGIPNHVPGLGFLDDAIMIELVASDLAHEIEAYRDFCSFREEERSRRSPDGASVQVTRSDWLAAKRAELHSRMARRRGRLRSLFS